MRSLITFLFQNGEAANRRFYQQRENADGSRLTPSFAASFQNYSECFRPRSGLLASRPAILALHRPSQTILRRTRMARTHINKLLTYLELAVLLLIIGASHSTNATANSSSNSDQKMASAPALSAPGTYEVDPLHSFAYFGARHHVVGLVRGRFDKVTGTIIASPDPAACSVDITIDPSTISTQVAERDDDLRSPAYFDVAKFPAITYTGRGIRRLSETSWTIDGSLTIHGVTKVVPLTFTFNGAFPDTPPAKPARVAFHGRAATKRTDFSLGARDNLQELGSLSSPDVEIEIDVEADEKLPTKSPAQ
jgi:polyisoprenoid-binding protein YceI